MYVNYLMIILIISTYSIVQKNYSAQFISTINVYLDIFDIIVYNVSREYYIYEE